MTVGLLSINAGAPSNWWGVDGSATAPSGTPQYSSLLNGYPTASPPGARAPTNGVQPPWMVAGVDYAVGIPSSVTLADPFGGLTASNANLATALKNAGGSWSSNTITFSGSSANNATVTGWDFSSNNGQQVVVQSCSNFTFDSCNFKVGSNLLKPLTVSASVNGFTLIRSVVDGNNLNYSPVGGLILINSYGTTTIQYSHIKSAWGQLIEAGTSSSGNPTHKIIYSVLHDSGLGFPVDGTHGDLVQYLVSGDETFADFECTFCLLLQNDALSTGAHTQGMSMFSAGGLTSTSGLCLNEVFNYNTIVATANCQDPILINNSYLNGSATCNYNYSYVVGSNGTIWLFFGQNNGGPGGIGPYSGTLNTLTGNINMNDGSSFNTHG